MGTGWAGVQCVPARLRRLRSTFGLLARLAALNSFRHLRRVQLVQETPISIHVSGLCIELQRLRPARVMEAACPMVWMQAACVEALCLIFGLPLISHRLTGFPAFILVAIQASLESRTAHPSVVLLGELLNHRPLKGENHVVRQARGCFTTGRVCAWSVGGYYRLIAPQNGGAVKRISCCRAAIQVLCEVPL